MEIPNLKAELSDFIRSNYWASVDFLAILAGYFDPTAYGMGRIIYPQGLFIFSRILHKLKTLLPISNHWYLNVFHQCKICPILSWCLYLEREIQKTPPPKPGNTSLAYVPSKSWHNPPIKAYLKNQRHMVWSCYQWEGSSLGALGHQSHTENKLPAESRRTFSVHVLLSVEGFVHPKFPHCQSTFGRKYRKVT